MIQKKEPYEISEIEIVDSDTIKGWCHVDRTVRVLWRIRLKRIEGGELGTVDGLKGSEIVRRILADQEGIPSWFHGNPNELDLHGRHVGDIEWANGVRLTAALMAAGHHWRRERNGREWRPEPRELNG